MLGRHRARTIDTPAFVQWRSALPVRGMPQGAGQNVQGATGTPQGAGRDVHGFTGRVVGVRGIGDTIVIRWLDGTATAVNRWQNKLANGSLYPLNRAQYDACAGAARGKP